MAKLKAAVLKRRSTAAAKQQNNTSHPSLIAIGASVTGVNVKKQTLSESSSSSSSAQKAYQHQSKNIRIDAVRWSIRIDINKINVSHFCTASKNKNKKMYIYIYIYILRKNCATEEKEKEDEVKDKKITKQTINVHNLIENNKQHTRLARTQK